MIVFVCGGSKSGKSRFAEEVSKKLYKEGNLIYLATMKPTGKEDLKRIENHIKDRKNTAFETEEIMEDIEKAKVLKTDTVLLDSVTSLLANEMFKNDEIIFEVSKKIVHGIKNVKDNSKNLIIVSDYIFSDGIVYDDITENYKKQLGYINREIAKIAEVVVEVNYELKTFYKGKEILKNEGIV